MALGCNRSLDLCLWFLGVFRWLVQKRVAPLLATVLVKKGLGFDSTGLFLCIWMYNGVKSFILEFPQQHCDARTITRNILIIFFILQVSPAKPLQYINIFSRCSLCSTSASIHSGIFIRSHTGSPFCRSVPFYSFLKIQILAHYTFFKTLSNEGPAHINMSHCLY